MRALVRALSAALLALAASTLAIGTASAQSTSVVVLGLTSIEGDDTFATNLSGALRQAASQVRGWTVSDRDVPLSQLELATGCDANELSCVQQIASTVGAQRLVYGTVQRAGAGSEPRFDFQIRIHLYDAATNTILRSIDERLPSTRVDIDDLREPARRYASTLAEGAGSAQSAGGASLPPEGEIGGGEGGGQGGGGGEGGGGQGGGGQGGGQQSGGGGDDLGRLNWPAFALLAVGIGSAVGWIVAGLDAQTNMERIASFRATGPSPAMGATDLSICNPQNIEANVSGPSRDAINAACTSPAEILQFVFMGAAVIAGVTGVALLAANGFMSPEAETDRVQLRLLPRASLNGGSLGLELTF